MTPALVLLILAAVGAWAAHRVCAWRDRRRNDDAFAAITFELYLDSDRRDRFADLNRQLSDLDREA